VKFLFIKRESLSLTDGISQFIFAVSDALLRLGHQVVCAASFDDKLGAIPQRFDFSRYPDLEALDQSYAAHCDPRRAARLWRRLGPALVARLQPDLIVLNGALPVRFARPTALAAHDLEQRKLFGNLGRILFKAVAYRMVDQLIVSSPELVVPVAKDSLCSPRRFLVIPTCIDTGRYAPRPLAEREPIVLHCGFQDYKHPRATLAAFGRIRHPAARLVLVGRVDPSVQAEVEALPPALRSRIELAGLVSAGRLKELLGTARVMSVPSEYVLPVASPTVLEAVASHTPCVLSAGISKLVASDGVNCFVETSPEAMARRFDELLANDQTWLALSQGCAETKTRFDSLTVARQYLALARRLAL
jgi:glycosyltransferase involved in cell wall biosynthesis